MSSDNQVVVNYIFCLDSIFDKDGVTHSVVDDVVYDVEVADSMDSHCSVVSLVDCITFYQRFRNCSDDVEMNWISTEFECLPNVEEFCIEDPSNAGFIFRVMYHDVGTIKIFRRGFRVALVLHVSCQEANFSPDINCICSIRFGSGVMFVIKLRTKSKFWLCGIN